MFNIDNPPTCFLVAGPIITSRGLDAKESTGSLIDIIIIHKSGKIAIKHQKVSMNPTVIFKANGRLNNLLSTIVVSLFDL